MEILYTLIMGIIFLSPPILIPFFKKKWGWFVTVVIGYALYILWGIYLHFTADPTEYGTGYGMLILPFLIFISVVGVFVQKDLDKNKKK